MGQLLLLLWQLGHHNLAMARFKCSRKWQKLGGRSHMSYSPVAAWYLPIFCVQFSALCAENSTQKKHRSAEGKNQ
jgi:hypothetical protein